jgi:hypothetical protein
MVYQVLFGFLAAKYPLIFDPTILESTPHFSMFFAALEAASKLGARSTKGFTYLSF